MGAVEENLAAAESVPRLILASASPARLTTLRAAGLDPEVIVSGVDESGVRAESPAGLVAALARLKAEAVWSEVNLTEDVVVIGCDSVLEFDGEVMGKPSDAAQAVQRWQQMRGGSGVLHTGHRVIASLSGRHSALGAVASTRVQFAEVTDAEIHAYVATGEPLAVAGAFTIDGLGGPFVRRLEGDPHAVVGISLPLLRELLGQLGLAWHIWWR